MLYEMQWHWNITGLITNRDTEERAQGGRTGLTDRRDVSSKEESSDKGDFVHDRLEVTVLRE